MLYVTTSDAFLIRAMTRNGFLNTPEIRVRLQDFRAASLVKRAVQIARAGLCGALLVLSSFGAQATIISVTTQNQASGSAPFDPAPGCSQRGQDCSATDLRVRTNDTYTLSVAVATDGAGAAGSTITMRYPVGAAYTASASAAGSYAYLTEPTFQLLSPSSCNNFYSFIDGADAVVVCELVSIAPNTSINVNIPIRTPVAVLEGTSLGLGSITVTGAAGATITRSDIPVTLTNALAPYGRKYPNRSYNAEMPRVAGSGPGGADGYVVTYTVERAFAPVSAKTQAGVAVVTNSSFNFDDALFTATPAVPAGTLLVRGANGSNVTGNAADGCFMETVPATYSCDVTSTGPTSFSAVTVPLTAADAKPVWPANGYVPDSRVTIRYWVPAASVTTDPTYLDNLATLTNTGTDLDGVQWPEPMPYNPADANDPHIGRATLRPLYAGGTFNKKFFRNLVNFNSGPTFLEYFAGYRDSHHVYFFMTGGADLHNVVMCDKIDNVFERLTGPAVFAVNDYSDPAPSGPPPAYTIDYGVGGAGGAGRTWAASGQPDVGDHATAGCGESDSPVWFADPLNPPTGYSIGDITRVRVKLALLPYSTNRQIDLQIPIEMSPATPASNTGEALLPGTRDIRQTAFTAGQPIPDGTVVYNYAFLTSDELSASRSDVVQVRQPKLLWGVNAYARNADGTPLRAQTLLGAGKALRFDIEWSMYFNNYFTGQETVTITEILSPQLSFQGTPPLPPGVSFTVVPDQPFTGFTRLTWTISTDLAQFLPFDPTRTMPRQNTMSRRAPFDLTYFATTNALATGQGLGPATHASITSPNAWLDCRAALTLGDGTGQFEGNLTSDCPSFRGIVYVFSEDSSNGYPNGGQTVGGHTLRFLTDAPAGFQIAKSLNAAGAPIGGFPLNTPFTFDIQWANTDSSTPTLTDARLLDVLPYIG
ncbi:MAG: hypothetical protein H7242_15070, partial [Microbacteriaceae bacterium]|nr:hypothetical protein [Burkholderiaceae bacterium]